VYVCVCVCERERERGRGREGERDRVCAHARAHTHIYAQVMNFSTHRKLKWTQKIKLQKIYMYDDDDKRNMVVN